MILTMLAIGLGSCGGAEEKPSWEDAMDEAMSDYEDAMDEFADELDDATEEIEEAVEDEEVVEEEETEVDVTAAVDVKGVTVDELPLPTRTINALKKSGITQLSQLAGKNKEDLADIKNVGDKSIDEIVKLLEKEGLSK